ncbi:MAG: M1 family aminopeptidase, partial [Candidatus Binataceae bacterium]
MASELGDRFAFSTHAAARRNFQPEHVEPRWPRDRVADIRHIRLEIALDFERRSISGVVTHRLAAIVDGLERLEFDQSELSISAVRVGGVETDFSIIDDKISVPLPAPLRAGEEIEVAIAYAARPRRGLYFVGPNDAYPGKPVQAWTQGEDEDSRFWFPCYDYPNDKASSEVIAAVPENFFAVSNGELIEVRADAVRGVKTYHWRQDIPHSAYLITLACGEFAEIAEKAGNTPVLYYVQPGREDDARRAFGKTPRMIEFYERRIGAPYPYARYAQVAVSDFIFGGMENTSA